MPVDPLAELRPGAVEIIGFLKANGHDPVAIGGLAIQYWGDPRHTHDIDLTVILRPEQERTFVAEVFGAFEPRRPDSEMLARSKRILTLVTSNGTPVDIGMGLPGLYEEAAQLRAPLVEVIPGVVCRVLSREDLVIYKCIAGREKDKEDVRGVLLRAQTAFDSDIVRPVLKAMRECIDTHDPLELFESLLSETAAPSPTLAKSRPTKRTKTTKKANP
jgi:hypothetical protein